MNREKNNQSVKGWYLLKSDTHQGPFSTEYLEKMMNNKDFKGSLKIWRQGLANWRIVQNSKDLKKLELLTPKEKVNFFRKKHFPPNINIHSPRKTVAKRPKNILKFLIFLLVLLNLLLISYLFITIYKTPFTKRPSLVRTEIVNLNLDMKNNKIIAIGKGLLDKLKINLLLTSLPNQILSKEKVVVNSQGIFNKNNEAHFSKWVFQEGSGLKEGNYLAHLKGEDGKKINVVRHFYWGNDEKEFSEKLKKFNSIEKNMASTMAQEDLLERYQTVIILLNKIFEIFKKTIVSKKQDKASFSVLYGRNVAPLMQNIIFSSKEQKIGPHGPQYLFLESLGKEIGGLIVWGVENIRRVESVKRRKSAYLGKSLELFSRKVKKIKEKIEIKLKNLKKISLS